MISAQLLNTAWRWQGAGEAWAFRRATRDVQCAQDRLLRRMLRENAGTAYGRKFGFADIRTVRDYQRRVPIVRYDDLHAYIERVAAGEGDVLTAEAVRLLEPTSGSTVAEKWIPYTDTLRRQFQRALSVWIWDVMGRMSGVRRGPAYWAVTPGVRRPRETPGGIRIGFADDSEYLSRWQRRIVSRLLVTPDRVAQPQRTDHFRYVTLLYLLASEPLALISVWSPTFLTTLLDQIPSWLERICADLRAGRVRLPGRTASARAQQLSGIFASCGTTSDSLRQCWPGLSLISCWADGASAMYADRLRAYFLSVPLQPKGLLATEGVVSFPLVGRPGSVLAIRSHFFEFREVADDPSCDSASDTPQLADELEQNRRYRVLLTTGGGLYRYDLGDEVEVVGHDNQCPMIRFVGRGGATSDLVGEKLNEHHVRRVVQRLCRQRSIQLDFAMLVPVFAQRPHYRLYLDGIGIPDDLRDIAAISAELDVGLSENPHYRLAVELDQLGPVDVGPLEVKQGTAWQLYEQQCRRRGQKAGDIKPTFLDPWPGWRGYFAAHTRSWASQ